MTETDVENPQTRHLQRPEGRIAYHMARHEPLVVRSRVERPVRPRLGIGNVRAVSRTVDRVRAERGCLTLVPVREDHA